MSEELPEPSDAEVEAWLRTPEGSAAMGELMKKVVAGELGQVPEEMQALAREGLKRHHSKDVLGEVQARMAELMRGIEELGQGGGWALARELHEKAKAVMDLLLEVEEPHRTKLMRLFLPLQEKLEAVMKKL